MKKLVELFKEGFLMYSNSQYGDVNWQAKRYEASLVKSNEKKVSRTKNLYEIN
ncbi:MAG: hypothetical protein ACQEXB_27955 [Bacillota bacterium]